MSRNQQVDRCEGGERVEQVKNVFVGLLFFPVLVVMVPLGFALMGLDRIGEAVREGICRGNK